MGVPRKRGLAGPAFSVSYSGNSVRRRTYARRRTGILHKSMSTNLWIVLFVGAVLALGYVLAVRVLYQQSREVDKHIDFTKIRPLPDEDGKD